MARLARLSELPRVNEPRCPSSGMKHCQLCCNLIPLCLWRRGQGHHRMRASGSGVPLWHLRRRGVGRNRTWRSVRGWREYLASALPCVGASCLEWWAYEGIILLAGWLPSPSAAVAVM